MRRRRVLTAMAVALVVAAVTVAAIAAFVVDRDLQTTVDPYYSADHEDPKVVLVMGASLSVELGYALYEALGPDITVASGTEIIATDQANWQVKIEANQPDVIVVSAGSTELGCLIYTCEGMQEEHAAYVKDVYDAAAVIGSKVIWFGVPRMAGPFPAWLTAPKEARATLDWLNDYDRTYAEDHGGTYISTDDVLTLATTLPGPDGSFYQSRKRDSFHMCPIASATLARAIAAEIVDQPRPWDQWWKGAWWENVTVNPIIPESGGARVCSLVPVQPTP